MSDNKELLRVAQYALEYIDGFPKDAQSTASGFDRHWADSIIAEAKAAQPVVLSDERILDIADSEGISFVTDERRPDNATIISFARAILAAKEQA